MDICGKYRNANLTHRVSITLVIQIAVFLFIIALALVDSADWPGLFFWLTMGSAAVINLANGAYQGCVYGLAARFPMMYTNSVTTGMNMSGTLASILSIISIAIAPSIKIEAVVFFSCAVVLLGVCLLGQFFIVRNVSPCLPSCPNILIILFVAQNFFKYFVSTVATPPTTNRSINKSPSMEIERTISYDDDESLERNGNEVSSISHRMQMQLSISSAASYSGAKSSSSSSSPYPKMPEGIEKSALKKYVYIFRCIWLQLLNIILIYLVSLSLFPAVHARILPNDNILTTKYFAPVFCFLSFNLFATVGNFIAQFIKWPGPNYLIVFTLARLIFIPFFLYCNYHPNDARTLPVIFEHDWQYILGSVLMATSSGYLSSLAMMYTPKCVPPQYATTAGMLAALTIILGILAGIGMSFIYPEVVTWA